MTRLPKLHCFFFAPWCITSLQNKNSAAFRWRLPLVLFVAVVMGLSTWRPQDTRRFVLIPDQIFILKLCSFSIWRASTHSAMAREDFVLMPIYKTEHLLETEHQTCQSVRRLKAHMSAGNPSSPRLSPGQNLHKSCWLSKKLPLM